MEDKISTIGHDEKLYFRGGMNGNKAQRSLDLRRAEGAEPGCEDSAWFAMKDETAERVHLCWACLATAAVSAKRVGSDD